MNGLIYFFTFIVIAPYYLVNSLGCSDIAPCKCYPNSKQIVCDSTSVGLTPEILQTKGKLVTGKWDILYIHQTTLEKILPETFQNAEFIKIFIVSNEHLISISPLAFKESVDTTSLIIRDNIKLDDNVNLFAIAHKLGVNLDHLEYDKNAISKVPDNALNDVTKKAFQKLKYIRLDDQQPRGSKLISIGDSSFANLPLLSQLSLDNNALATIGVTGIDLSASMLADTEHIIVFLNDNHLKETEVIKIKPPPAGKASVGLVLNNNNIENLTTKLVEWIIGIVNVSKNKVFLKIVKPPACNCADVKLLVPIIKEPNKKLSIPGLETTCKNGNDPNLIQLEACPTTP